MSGHACHDPDHEHDEGQRGENPRLDPTARLETRSWSGKTLRELVETDDPGRAQASVFEASPPRAANGLQAPTGGAHLTLLGVL
jgi:hypothetical protein